MTKKIKIQYYEIVEWKGILLIGDRLEIKINFLNANLDSYT